MVLLIFDENGPCFCDRFGMNVFYFLFTIVMKVLISCTENPKFFIEVLDELEFLIFKEVIFDEFFFFL
jgi:hypothetical protein